MPPEKINIQLIAPVDKRYHLVIRANGLRLDIPYGRQQTKLGRRGLSLGVRREVARSQKNAKKTGGLPFVGCALC
jgi:hypothetical protein